MENIENSCVLFGGAGGHGDDLGHGGEGGSVGAQAGRGTARETSKAIDEEEEESMPCSRPTGGQSDRGRGKCQRNASPSGWSMVSLGEMFLMMNTTIASAVASTGSAVSPAFASEREHREQEKHQLHELQLKEDRRRIEEEVAGRYRAEIEGMKAKVEGVGKTVGDLKEKHDTQMKVKNDAHAAELKTAKEVIVCFQLILIP